MLGVTTKTVVNTLASAYRKLGIDGHVQKRGKALAEAVGRGWISVDEVETGDDWRGDV